MARDWLKVQQGFIINWIIHSLWFINDFFFKKIDFKIADNIWQDYLASTFGLISNFKLCYLKHCARGKKLVNVCAPWDIFQLSAARIWQDVDICPSQWSKWQILSVKHSVQWHDLKYIANLRHFRFLKEHFSPFEFRNLSIHCTFSEVAFVF